MRLGRLPSSLRVLLTSLAITCGAVPVSTEQVLTPENFQTSIAHGVWFIEHYSPYCGHCRQFAPTWDELVKIGEADVPTINLAQVNCAVHGDLCTANGIKGYPTLSIYKDGNFVETFKGSRDLDKLVPYIKLHAPSPAAPPPPPPSPPSSEVQISTNILNPNGVVTVLDEKTFTSTVSEGPTFVKFYAPWCGHCKKLAPTWVKIAKLFQGKLTIAEVDCDANKSLCAAQGIEGYPTLAYYSAGGVKTEYNGGRKLEQLAAFAEKANAPPAKAVGAQDLDTYIQENDIAYVLLHSSADTLASFNSLFSALLGTPAVYTVADAPEAVLSRYGVTGSWALLAFKDHDSTTPTSIMTSKTPAVDKDETLLWLLGNRLPPTIELTQDTFQSVMKSPAKPLVVLAAVTDDSKEALKKRFEMLSTAWRKAGKHDREVVFAWMDLERWKDWMKSMYGVTKKGKALKDVTAVVVDHQELVYWNIDGAGNAIDVLDEKSVFSAVEGAIKGSISYNHSENIMERIARFINSKVSGFEGYIVAHPIQTVFGFLTLLGVIVLAMRRWVLSDLPDEKYYRDKGGRLD